MRFCLSFVAMLALLVTTANAEFTVWVSDKAPDQNPIPGALNLTLTSDVAATGTLYVYGDGDTQIGGFSFDMSLTGNAIKFVNPVSINNPASRWSFPGVPTVSDNLVDNFEAVAIPPGAVGVGGALADEIPGVGFLLGSIGYMGLGTNNTSSNLMLTVSDNLFADYATGGDVSVRLGGPGVPACSGSETTCSGAAGAVNIMIDGGGEDPVVGNLNLATSFFQETLAGVVPLTDVDDLNFDNVSTPGFVPTIPGKPLILANLPTLDDNGNFSWNTTGSLRGTYTWAITGTNAEGSDGGLITVQVNHVPEPATFAMLGLAAVGLVGMIRRRS